MRIPNAKILVVGNPCNTNCYIAMKTASKFGRLKARNFTAMLRLDHNRALSQLADQDGQRRRLDQEHGRLGQSQPDDVSGYSLHENRRPRREELVNEEPWYKETFIPTVGKRGAAIIEARGLSSAACAANAAIDHMRDWWLGSKGEWVTMGVPSDGSYGIPEGIIYGLPCTTEGGDYKIVQGLDIDAFSREKMNATLKELEEERTAVAALMVQGRAKAERA